MTPTTVYLFKNGMCMVFDENGKQVPKWQGETSKVLRKLKLAYPEIVVKYGEMK